jgi:hypothetical protein
MLSRGASDASARLRRSKSSTSVKQRRCPPLVQENVDPEKARQHALAAAHIAMDRANERASAEMKRSAELSRNQSNASRARGATPRSQNIRFCDTGGPRLQRTTLQSKTSTAATSLSGPASNSYSQLSNGGNGPPLNDFGVVDGYGSIPSSYRRLRKTKSMLTPRHHGNSVHDLSPQSPGTPRTLRTAKTSLGGHDNGLRLGLKRSMSFLKLSSGNISKTFKRAHSTSEENDAAVERARNQFLQDVEQQRLYQKPSFLSTAKGREQKAFRKTVRSDRITENDDGTWSEQHQTKQEFKFRSFSASLRDRVRRVLGRSPSKDTNLPAQQLDASRAHFRDYLNGTEVNISQEECESGKPSLTYRGSLHVPSSQKESTLEDLEAISRSLKSMHSNDSLCSNSRSRVSSWTNSTVTNSLPGRGTPIERKRLSIIQEHGGPHQPSSSIGRHMYEVTPAHLSIGTRPGNGQPIPPIDSQRVYSALTKRIDQEQGEQERAKTPKAAALQHSGQNCMSRDQSFQTVPTIRQVASEESIYGVAPDDRHRHFSPQAPSWEQIEGRVPQEIAQENEIRTRPRLHIALGEDQSSFFPFSSENKPQTSSPLKLALAARRKRQTSSEEENSSVIVSRPIQGDSEFETSSESQYSRTMSGQLPMTGMDCSEPERDDEPEGTATIVPARVNRYPRPSPSLVQLHKAKSNASVEWDSWMNPQMTGLDRRNSKSSTTHYRESAQIDGDDTDVGGRPGSATGQGHRSSDRTARANWTPRHERRASITNERFPLVEVNETSRNNTPKPRRYSSVTKLVSSAAADVKRVGLTAIGINDENTRISSSEAPSSGKLWAQYSQVPFDGGEEPTSTLGQLQHQHQQQQVKRLARPQSSMTITSQYGKVAEASGAGEDGKHGHGPGMTSRSNRLFEHNGYDGSFGGSRVPLAASPCPRDRTELERDVALPRAATSAGKKRRNDKVGMGMQSSSKRMVSNFLRSRRRNSAGGSKGAGEGRVVQADEVPAFL